MDGSALGSIKLSDIFSPKSAGETVNVHVVQAEREPAPDFAAMQRVISGGDKSRSAPEMQRAPEE